LVFQLNREEYAIQVLKVREIVGLQDITVVPRAPSCIRGVINLRGKVIPVVDLRRQFGMPEIAFTPRTCIVVVQVQGEAGAMLLGVIVDEVAEVVDIPEADIVDAPDFGRGATTPYVLGMAKSKGKVKILLDIDRLLNIHELQRAARSAE